VTGLLRSATTSSLADEVLAPAIAPFLVRHPGLSIQLMISGQNVNFSRWEADLAVRLRKPQKGNFTITKLANVRLYLFEPRNPIGDGQSDPVVCGYPDDLDQTQESIFLNAQGFKARRRCITETPRVIRKLIQSHQAIGILPEYMCGDLLADRQLRATLLPQRRDVWLLVQDHLKRDPATRVVIEWMRELFGRLEAD
jgi:DNA-binding transcriptional LysR family regulator